MTFTFDPNKAATNLRKHGVSFDEVITAFGDPLRLIQMDEVHSQDEERMQMLALSARGRLLFVVYTEVDSSVRLISARVATATERRQYEELG